MKPSPTPTPREHTGRRRTPERVSLSHQELEHQVGVLESTWDPLGAPGGDQAWRPRKAAWRKHLV